MEFSMEEPAHVGSTATCPDLSGLWSQLANAVALAAKGDQIVWTIFGIFSASNALLLSALLTGGAAPRREGAMVLSAAGVVLSVVWFLIQLRVMKYLAYYETIIRVLEDEFIKVPRSIALGKRLPGIGVRPLMRWFGALAALMWAGSIVYFLVW